MTNPTLPKDLKDKIRRTVIQASEMTDREFKTLYDGQSYPDVILTIVRTKLIERLPKPENFGNGFDDLVHLDEVLSVINLTLGGK